jgi:hypothetical protein
LFTSSVSMCFLSPVPACNFPLAAVKHLLDNLNYYHYYFHTSIRHYYIYFILCECIDFAF